MPWPAAKRTLRASRKRPRRPSLTTTCRSQRRNPRTTLKIPQAPKRLKQPKLRKKK
jgi:hypothetical protein